MGAERPPNKVLTTHHHAMNGKTIFYVIIDDPKPGADEPQMIELGEVTEGSVFTAEDNTPTEDVPTPTLTFSMSVKMEYVVREERHSVKEQLMLGWKPEPTRPPAPPRRPHGRPYWFRIRSFCIRRGWH